MDRETNYSSTQDIMNLILNNIMCSYPEATMGKIADKYETNQSAYWRKYTTFFSFMGKDIEKKPTKD